MLRAAMAIRFVEIKAAESTEALNTEWVILENAGKTPFSHARLRHDRRPARARTRSRCSASSIPASCCSPATRCACCTGNPGTQAHGAAPEDGVKNYFLFLPKTYVGAAGTVLTLVLRGLPVSKAEFDARQPGGVAAALTK